MSDGRLIFISWWADEQRGIAERIYDYLARHGLRPWLDSRDLMPGDRWDEEVPRVLARAEVMLVLISGSGPAAGRAVWQEREELRSMIESARESEARVIPVVIDGATDHVPYGLQYIVPLLLDSRDPEPALSGLVNLVAPQSDDSEYPVDDAERGPLDGSRDSLMAPSERRPRRRVPILRTTIQTLRSDGGLDHLPPPIAALGGALLAGAIGGALLTTPGWLRFIGGAAMLGVGCAALLRPRWVDREPLATTTSPKPRPVTRDVLDMVPVPAGRSTMGSPPSDDMAYSDETPQFEAAVPSPLMVQRCPVTNGEYRRLVPDHAPGEADDLPVTDVDWFDAVRFCNAMSEAAALTPVYAIDEDAVRWQSGDGYRLLTEVEWEYACRAGSAARYSFGDDPAELGEYAWFDGNSGYHKHPVGAKRANAFGLFDMHGNVWEWCWSAFEGYPLAAEPTRRQPASVQRVLRGGGFDFEAGFLRAAFRGRNRPELRVSFIGFRCARGPRPESTVAP